MKQWRDFGFGVGCFALGMLVQTAVAQNRKLVFTADLVQGKDARAAAATLLEGALQLAEGGSWERIAVGRAWYFGGDKTKGQKILDEVTGGKKVAASDWFRIGRVYVEAGEWDKAQPAFDRALTINAGDDSGMIEYGGFANINHNREKAEALFTKAFRKNPREFWHWVNAGGFYLGVRPQ